MNSSATLIANAKINTFLDITGKREDGYHLLETVMQSIDLSDFVTVELTSDDEITVSCSDPTVPEDEGNICYKAADLFFALLGERASTDIYIDKRIPQGAGLGGGSADAAAVLRGLNALYENPFDEETMLKLALKTGADVPFCMVGGTKLCRGIGEVMTEEAPYPARYFLIVKPGFKCDTKSAYSDYDAANVPRKERQKNELYNVFREIYKNDEINSIIQTLKELGANGAELTGSGSAVFGAFTLEGEAIAAAKKFPNHFTAVCRPVSKGTILINNV